MGCRLIAVSGLRGKGPACFLVETARTRFLLDLGYGPQPGLWPDVSEVGRVDAVLLSHGHRDHAGALGLLARVGDPPVYATGSVLRQIGREESRTTLPLAGESDVCGVHVRTGRNGHAPGGVWLHLEAGDGLLYMGDYNVESAVYANDTPPPAGTVILDASYGAYDDTLGECTARLMPFLERGLALFPVPPGGRGPEMALHILQTRREPPHIGDDLRAAIGRLTDADCGDLRPGVADALARLAREAPPIAGRSGLMLTGTADAADGEAARLAASWEKEETPDIVFSGYLPPGTPAQRLVEAGRAHYVRWNVHPRLSDNAMLVKTCGARTALPAFGDEKHLAAWRKAFAPARVVTSGVVDF